MAPFLPPSPLPLSRPTYLLVAASELRRGQDMRDGAEAMEQHGHELDNQNEGEEEHEHQTDRFQLQVFLRDGHLEVIIR